MKNFLKKIILFCVSLLFFLLGLIFTTKYVCEFAFDFDISFHKNVLVVGDSHPASAIDDTILSNTYNLAQPASAYFYTFLKVRDFIAHNPHIDTLVVGYSYGDLQKTRDIWLTEPDILRFKMQNYFFLFSLTDYRTLTRANPDDVLLNTPQVILHNIKTLFTGPSALGGYTALTEHEVQETIQKYGLVKEEQREAAYSEIQEKYLLKIYDYCLKNDVQLVLLATPIHPWLEQHRKKYRERYYELHSQYMPRAMLVDHSGMRLPYLAFADLEHLNTMGSTIYSNYLKMHGFKNSAEAYSEPD